MSDTSWVSGLNVFYSWYVAVSVAVVDELDAKKGIEVAKGWMYAETEPTEPIPNDEGRLWVSVA
jgi:hypothetical protein